MTPSLMTRARDYLSLFSNKFFKEGLPIAMASAIGALVVGQFNKEPSKPPVPPAIIVQAAPVPAAAAPGEPERVVDQLKRDSDAKPAATMQETKAKPSEERRPRQAEQRHVEKTARLPVKQIPERKIVTVDSQPLSAAPAPLPVTPAPAAAPLPVSPAPAASAPAESRGVGDWVVGALPLPTRVTGAADRGPDDAPVPPLPVPQSQDQVGARM